MKSNQKKFILWVGVPIIIFTLAFVGLPIWTAFALCNPGGDPVAAANRGTFLTKAVTALRGALQPQVAFAGGCTFEPSWVWTIFGGYEKVPSHLYLDGTKYWWYPNPVKLYSTHGSWLYVYNSTNDPVYMHFSVDYKDVGHFAVAARSWDYHPTQCTTDYKGKTFRVDPGEEGGDDYLVAPCI